MQFIYLYLISYSLIGYGIILSNYLKLRRYSFGYLGILGLTFLLLISFLSSIFIAHGKYTNFFILILGLASFFFNRTKVENLKHNFLLHLFVFFFLFIFITVSKNHDDFAYYHFPYISILTEFPHPFGLGLLNNGFRSPSSLFFIGSMFYLPGIDVYLFHITPALVLGFVNLVLINNIFDKDNFERFKFSNFISLTSFIFINIFFYRLAEHGTDRSGMIIVIMSIILLIKVVNLNYKNCLNDIKFLIISLCFAVTFKPFYLINFLFIFLFLTYKKTRYLFLKLFFTNTFWYCVFLILFIIFYTFINTGCLFFPINFTCFENLPWSLDSKHIYDVKIWFELWSKAGATPNMMVDDRVSYIRDFNWLKNWINQYFFNKVSDFILGLLALLSVIFFIFKNNINYLKIHNIKFFNIYILIFFLILEWFLFHPTLRYGGYHLIYLFIFIPLCVYLHKSNLKFQIFYKKIFILLIITAVIFATRNFYRLHDEYNKYGFNPLLNSKYSFIGGNKEFYFKYNSHIRNRYNSYNYLEFFKKKYIYLSKDNF